MKKTSIIALLAAAILVAGIITAGCTQDSGYLPVQVRPGTASNTPLLQARETVPRRDPAGPRAEATQETPMEPARAGSSTGRISSRT